MRRDEEEIDVELNYRVMFPAWPWASGLLCICGRAGLLIRLIRRIFGMNPFIKMTRTVLCVSTAYFAGLDNSAGLTQAGAALPTLLVHIMWAQSLSWTLMESRYLPTNSQHG